MRVLDILHAKYAVRRETEERNLYTRADDATISSPVNSVAMCDFDVPEVRS